MWVMGSSVLIQDKLCLFVFNCQSASYSFYIDSLKQLSQQPAWMDWDRTLDHRVRADIAHH